MSIKDLNCDIMVEGLGNVHVAFDKVQGKNCFALRVVHEGRVEMIAFAGAPIEGRREWLERNARRCLTECVNRLRKPPTDLTTYGDRME